MRRMIFRRQRPLPQDHASFAGLPIRHVVLSDGRTRAAVHVSGRFAPDTPAVVCLAGYQRNMSDFSVFARQFTRLAPEGWPLVLVDLPGRGRATDRRRLEDYSSIADATDLADVLAALGIPRAVLVGQGHGGQVAMALAAAHPLLVAGTVLLDSGPVSDSRGIVRLRNNLAHVAALRGKKAVTAGFRKMLGGDYPGLNEAELDGLIGRTHWLDRRSRVRPLFDPRLIEALGAFNFDDVLVAQWPLFDALRCAPLLLMRTQLTDQLRRETFEEMVRRRPDATALTIAGQGSPALFDQAEEIEAVTRFVLACRTGTKRRAA